MALTDEDVQEASRLLLRPPRRHVRRHLERGVRRLRGDVPRGRSSTPAPTTSPAQIRPLTNTLGFAAPLIAAGLGVALALPRGPVQHRWPRSDPDRVRDRGAPDVQPRPADRSSSCRSTLAAGIAGGAIWGGIVGVLKARTGAHEVILTIMLNYVAFYLVTWMVRTPALLQRPAGDQPISDADPGRTRSSPSSSAPLPAAGLGLHHRDRRHRVRVVAGRALEPRLPPARGGREPARSPGIAASRCSGCTSTRCCSRAAWRASPA